jgi:threonine synthase
MILYRDTRGAVEAPRSFTEAILEGIAPGGGLFVPERLPRFAMEQIVGLAAVPYHARAAAVYEAFGLDVPAARTREIAARAYGPNFDHPEVAPVVEVAPGRHVLELWHGPTLAFKDMALQCMPLYFSEALEQAHAKGATDLDFLILVATSGDTGVAALNGYADRAHTRICVFYPDAGVSALQELQMVTQPGDNLTVYRLAGDFDDCQSSVKAVFDDAAFAGELAERHGLALSSANSINWGRLLPQIVYYMSGYADLAARGAVAAGDPIDVCVPTGNFGNILAAWYARDIGVPIRRLLCASNSNNVLYDFLSSGVYDIAARSLVKTPSPSMDILISSNLERLLYDLTGDAARIAGWMAELKASGRFTVDDETHDKLTGSPPSGWTTTPACRRSAVCSASRATCSTPTRPWRGRPRSGSAATCRCSSRAPRTGASSPPTWSAASPACRPARRSRASTTTSSCSTGSSTSHPARASRRSCAPCAPAGGASTPAWSPAASRSSQPSGSGSPAPDRRPPDTPHKETP